MYRARFRLGALLAALVATANTTPVASVEAASSDQGIRRPAKSDERGPVGSDKSIAFYVGKNRTTTGSTLIGGFGHEPSSHWLEIVPRQRHPAGSEITVGATGAADLPGKRTRIPQVSRTAKYITSNYSEFSGFPAPLTNGGLNEHGVAARDVWSDSRSELVEMTPPEQSGPHYSDLSRIAMERARSARHAVRILGDLINKYGYTSYGGNSHMFADANEGWVLIEYAGGNGLWAAQRLGPDDVRVSYPGYIDHFPIDYQRDPNHMGSPNLIDFAARRGWWRPGTRFDPQDVYGMPFPGHPGKSVPTDPAPWRHPPTLESELRELSPVSLVDMQRMVRDPRWSDDRSGYGQVAELGSDLPHPELATLWVANTAAVTAPYIPYHLGASSVPPEYRQHRYLTSESASEYLDPEYAAQEATRSATYLSKRLLYYTCDRPRRFLGEVTSALEGFEADILNRVAHVRERATNAYRDGEPERARALLTDFSHRWADNGVRLTEYLVDDIEARTKREFGIRRPDVETPEGHTSRPDSMRMALPEDAVSARDRVHCDLGNGWADGSTVDRKGERGDPAAVPDYRAPAATGEGFPWLIAGVSGVVGALVGAGALALARRRG